jgi:hypothetical protein
MTTTGRLSEGQMNHIISNALGQRSTGLLSETTFRTNGTMGIDFGEALADTMRLFSIGIVRDRWSSIGVIQTAPLRSLPDGEYKSAVKKIDAML